VLSHLFIVFFLLLYRLSANTSNPYTVIMLLIFTHSMIYFIIFEIKICHKIPKTLTVLAPGCADPRRPMLLSCAESSGLGPRSLLPSLESSFPSPVAVFLFWRWLPRERRSFFDFSLLSVCSAMAAATIPRWILPWIWGGPGFRSHLRTLVFCCSETSVCFGFLPSPQQVYSRNLLVNLRVVFLLNHFMFLLWFQDF
jgi:hypothetical protein